MKILVDENIPKTIIQWLRDCGHDVEDVRGTTKQGIADGDLWSEAMSSGRMLITTDRGFTARRVSDHHGILVIRLRQPNRAKIHSAIQLAMNRITGIEWRKRLVVVRDRTMSVSLADGWIERS